MYLIYCPFPNLKQAKKIGKEIIKKKLCCCVNILKSFSMYLSKNRIKEEKEFVLIAKTINSKVNILEKELKKHHPYRIPAVIRIKVDKINKEYEKWCADV